MSNLLKLCFLLLFASPTAFAQLNAKLLGQLNPYPGIHNRYGDIWGEGQYAYLCSYQGSNVTIIDISDPRAPKVAGVFEPPGGPSLRDAVVLNGIGYFSSDDGKGLYIVDVRDPKNLRQLSNITAAQSGHNNVHEISVSEGFLYEADSRTPRVKVIDVSDPARPVFKWDIDCQTTGAVHSALAINGRLYASGLGGSTEIYDVRNTATTAPRRLGVVASGLASHSSWPSNDGRVWATCSERDNGDTRLYDLTDPATPRLLSTITAASIGIDAFTPHNPVIVGNLLFVAWYQAGTQVFDITDPTRPVRVGEYDCYPGPLCPNNFCYAGNWGVYPFLGLDRVLLSDLDGGLFIVDFSAAGTGVKTVSAASFSPAAITPKAIVAAFGSNLAGDTRAALTQPLPTDLAGVRVSVLDYAGVERAAPLFFVSPAQINYQIPADSKPGPALVKVSSSDGTVRQGATTILPTAPAMFTTNQAGNGPAVALDALTYRPAPFAATRANGEPNIIALFGTGLGNDATDAALDVGSNVSATLNAVPVTVLYAGATPGLTGSNQINIVLPTGLTAGEYRLTIWRNGIGSNEVTLAIR
ncbi:MAG: hypothetical protein HYR56_12150 [Acidobacteria bacterium]|nr:hypothetical protein [Acidobacteriota bacterium]MBI3428260.1 hypothetical protein [Acidobacteriota bacterium]